MLSFLKDSASWEGDLYVVYITNKICNLCHIQLGALVAEQVPESVLEASFKLVSIPSCY